MLQVSFLRDNKNLVLERLQIKNYNDLDSIDEIIDPRSTRAVLINSLLVVRNRKLDKPNYGVLQV